MSKTPGYTAGDIMIYRYRKDQRYMQNYLKDLTTASLSQMNWSMFNAKRAPSCKESKPLIDDPIEDVEGLI